MTLEARAEASTSCILDTVYWMNLGMSRIRVAKFQEYSKLETFLLYTNKLCLKMNMASVYKVINMLDSDKSVQ